MNVSCGSCPAKYAVPDAKVRGKRVKITCKRCGAAILIDGTTLDADGTGAPATAAAPAEASPSSPAREPSAPAAAKTAPAGEPKSAPAAAKTAPAREPKSAPAAAKTALAHDLKSVPAAAVPAKDAAAPESSKAAQPKPAPAAKPKPPAEAPRVAAPRPAPTPKTPAAAPMAPSASVVPAGAPPAFAGPARTRAAKKTMMGVPAPFVAPPTGSPAVAEGPAQRQQVVVSARRGFEAEPEPAPIAAARKRAHKQTIMGGLQAPTFSSAPPPAASAAPPGEPHWTVALTDIDHRDMTTSELVALFAIGKVTTETLVWRDGMPQWARPFDVPEVAEALRARGHAPPVTPAAATPPAAQADEDDEVTRMVASPLEASLPAALPPPPAAAAPERGGWDLDEDEVTRAMDADAMLGKKRAAAEDVDDDEVTRAVESPLAAVPRLGDFPAPSDASAALKQASAPSALPWPEPPKGLDIHHEQAAPAIQAPPPSRPSAARPVPSNALPPPAPIPHMDDELGDVDEDDEDDDEGSSLLRWLVAAIVVALMAAGAVFGVFYTEQPAPAYQRLRTVTPLKILAFIDRVTVGLGKHPPKTPAPPPPPVHPSSSSTPPAPKLSGPAFDQLAAGRIMAETAANAQSCQRPGGPTGLGHVLVTFDRSGNATKVQVLDAFTNSESGRCIEQLFLKAQVPAFAEPPVTVQKSFTIQ